MKKPKKIRKYEADGFLFNTFKQLKTYIWYKTSKNFVESKKTIIFVVSIRKEVNMTQEELKELENLLWKYKLKYAKELNKKELKSVIEVLALLIIKINK